MHNISHKTQEFLTKVCTNQEKRNICVDVSLVKVALDYVQLYHKGQKRHSGEPYYYHPLEVANVTMDYLFNTESIVSALLHDILEDTTVSFSQLEFIFGKEIAEIVHVLSKVTYKYKLSKDETFYQLNSFQDIELKAITIKVIDRLHNMRTINHIKSLEKQKRIATETLQFYIPLAKAANLNNIGEELREITARILNL